MIRRWYLISWIRTSTVHAYPCVHFSGTDAECEARRALCNFPERLAIVDTIPEAY